MNATNYSSKSPPVKILTAEYSLLAFDSEKELNTAERDKVARLTMDLKTLVISKDICKMAKVLKCSK